MIITDTLLAERQRTGKPIRVGVAGPGFMARGMMNHIHHTVPGMEIAAVFARDPGKALAALDYAGYARGQVREAGSAADIDGTVSAGAVAVTDDFGALAAAGTVDVVVDATGAVEFGAQLALAAIDNGKHLVLMNAELDATLGTVLAHRARSAGVVYTGMDGDQPAVQMNLIRFVRGLGLRPLVAGNIKGLQDRFRNPTTQESFARKWGQDPHMVTSFADGTKVSVEQALVANAADLSVHRRGCLGRDFSGHVDELVGHYDVDELIELGGAVDYVVGASPGPGVYVLATQDDPRQRHYLNLYKLGEGPLYSFYAPYHLCHFEVPATIARAALLNDAAIAPLLDGRGTRVEVVTMAKKNLRVGDTLDAKGGYTYYGECEKGTIQRAQRLLPLGLAEGCVLKRDIAVEEAIGIDDVRIPPGRLADRLRAEQDSLAHSASVVAA